MHPTQLLVLSFIYKLLSRKNIFNNIQEKHGNETARQCRQLEKSITKLSKVKLDLYPDDGHGSHRNIEGIKQHNASYTASRSVFHLQTSLP